MSSYVILPIDELTYFSRWLFNHQAVGNCETLGAKHLDFGSDFSWEPWDAMGI